MVAVLFVSRLPTQLRCERCVHTTTTHLCESDSGPIGDLDNSPAGGEFPTRSSIDLESAFSIPASLPAREDERVDVDEFGIAFSPKPGIHEYASSSPMTQ